MKGYKYYGNIIVRSSSAALAAHGRQPSLYDARTWNRSITTANKAAERGLLKLYFQQEVDASRRTDWKNCPAQETFEKEKVG